MHSNDVVRFYKLDAVRAQWFATPRAKTGALDLPPGTYAVNIGQYYFLLRILIRFPISVSTMAPLASYTKELEAGFVDVDKPTTSLSVKDFTDAQTMFVMGTASFESYEMTRVAKIGENIKTLVLKVKQSRYEHVTAWKIPNPRNYDEMSSSEWIQASQAWLNEYSVHNQLTSTQDARNVCWYLPFLYTYCLTASRITLSSSLMAMLGC